jgi:acyl-CoA thioesterase-1
MKLSMDVSYGALAGAVERLARVLMVAAAGIMMAMSGPGRAQTPDVKNVKPVKLAVLGDSLTAGYGLPASAAFPVRLQKALQEKGITTEIINAGVSGDTASGGRDRLDWSIPPDTEAVIVELGANDALRGVDPATTRAALEEIVKKLKARNIAVLLCGMYAPPNLGPDYGSRFNGIYPDLAKAYSVPLYPFFLEGVTGDAKLTQPDGLHPTAAGVDVVVQRILPTVEAFLKDRT